MPLMFAPPEVVYEYPYRAPSDQYVYLPGYWIWRGTEYVWFHGYWGLHRDGWAYVYGGHIAPTHVYSTAAVSGRFSRLRLADRSTWERLPDGPPLQGMNLAAHRGQIYRVGGMQPHNQPGEPQDVRSVADVARFDPAIGRWDMLPPLPAPPSSTDKS